MRERELFLSGRPSDTAERTTKRRRRRKKKNSIEARLCCCYCSAVAPAALLLLLLLLLLVECRDRTGATKIYQQEKHPGVLKRIKRARRGKKANGKKEEKGRVKLRQKEERETDRLWGTKNRKREREKASSSSSSSSSSNNNNNNNNNNNYKGHLHDMIRGGLELKRGDTQDFGPSVLVEMMMMVCSL
jgi:hypothetical protein